MMERSITYEEVKRRAEERRKIAEAYLRARIEARSNNNNNGNNNTDLNRLEKVAILLNKASLMFKEAMNSNVNGSKRRELLEELFRAYVDIVPFLAEATPYLT